MKALGKLGLREAVLEAGNPLRPSGQFRTRRGEVLLELPTEMLERRFGDVTVGIHRAELQKVLLGALREAGGEVRLSSEFIGLEQDAGGIVARFARFSNGRGGGRDRDRDRSTEHEERADLLVGADGLRSGVRERLLGDGPPPYAGYAAWRGIVEPAEEFLAGTAGFEAWGCGVRFGLVALGRGRAYWFATKNADEPEGDVAARREELMETLGDWHEPVPSIVRSTAEDDLHHDGIYHRESAERRGTGRATLLGDAAHPMTPDLGQGACQAVEDAAVLADALGRGADAVAGLRKYEERRKERAADVARRSLRAGRIAHADNPLLCRARDALMRAMPKKILANVQLRQMEPVVAHEV
jgi:2-polyprenyl-6-methoxyphenol hydroxylase-like FAD-dependent oxidoreductase